jgi:hypothetical protein
MGERERQEQSWLGPPESWEVWTEGTDEMLQGIGSDPFGSITYTGLRVPTLASAPDNRYLFMLCSFQIGEPVRKRILGWREIVTLGFVQTVGEVNPTRRLVEQVVESPIFRFQDGNVSFHLRQITPLLRDRIRNNQGPLDPLTGQPFEQEAENLAFRISSTPALLYEDIALSGSGFYFDLSAYTPPNGGHPYGQPLAHLGTMHSPFTSWRTWGAWNALDIDVFEPGTYAMFASVKQTNPQTRVPLVAPNPFQFTSGLSDEEQFLQNFPGAIYWRVGAALRVMEVG